MADVQIEGALIGNEWDQAAIRLVTTGPATAYAFFVNSAYDLAYRKTTDSGATWSAATVIHTGTVTTFGVWFDEWTDGSGTLIHIAFCEFTGSTGRYNSLDTADDSLTYADGSEVTIWTGTSGTGLAGWLQVLTTITKVLGGNLYVAQKIDLDLDFVFARSTDSGATWAARTAVFDGNDVCLLLPGNTSGGDNQDCWAIYWDYSANELSLKEYDDSLNTWAETSIATGMVDPATWSFNLGAVQRQSDDHAIVAAWNAFDAATADLKVWDVASSASITAKTDVVQNTAEAIEAALCVNQQNDDLYVAYLSGTAWGSALGAFYQKSTDGGTTWDGQTAMSADVEDDHRYIGAPCSISSNGGLFAPVWVNDDLADLMCNADNAVSIAAAVAVAARLRALRGVGA